MAQRQDSYDDEVLGVEEFLLAKALLEGQQEQLGGFLAQVLPLRSEIVICFNFIPTFPHIDITARYCCKLCDHRGL